MTSKFWNDHDTQRLAEKYYIFVKINFMKDFRNEKVSKSIIQLSDLQLCLKSFFVILRCYGEP